MPPGQHGRSRAGRTEGAGPAARKEPGRPHGRPAAREEPYRSHEMSWAGRKGGAGPPQGSKNHLFPNIPLSEKCWNRVPALRQCADTCLRVIVRLVPRNSRACAVLYLFHRILERDIRARYRDTVSSTVPNFFFNWPLLADVSARCRIRAPGRCSKALQ